MSLRKSLRKSSSRSTIFYLDSYEMKERAHFSFNSGLETSKGSPICLPMINFLSDEQMIPVKPIEGAILFALSSNRSKGTVGQLVLTSRRLVFIPYQATNAETNADGWFEQAIRCPPFELQTLINSELTAEDEQRQSTIDYYNLFGIYCKQNVLQLYLSDFRCVEMQLKNSLLVKQLANQLERFVSRTLLRYLTNHDRDSNAIANGNALINSASSTWLSSSSLATATASSSSSSSLSNSKSQSTSPRTLPSNNSSDSNQTFSLSSLWQLLLAHFRFDFPSAWLGHESYWFEQSRLLRLTQVNENKQMCKTMPCTFVTLKHYLTDVNLLQNISNRMKGQRVPIVTYSNCRITSTDQSAASWQKPTLKSANDHFLIRSGLLDKEVTYALVQAISPIRILRISDLLTNTSYVLHVYIKLRRVCFLYANTSRFFTKIGKWLKIVGNVLSVCYNLCETLTNESSLVLMEEEDNQWNSLISSLIQIILDPNKRTVAGFNVLLAKEWAHLNGCSIRIKNEKFVLTQHVLFVLFLDCLHQLLSQNPNQFEFTSLYLFRCFDLSCDYSLSSQAIESQSSASNAESLLFHNLTIDQIMFYYNPSYEPIENCKEKSEQLEIHSDILSLKFWRSFYLRWFLLRPPIAYYNQFDCVESVYFNELIKSKPEFNYKQSLVLNGQFEQISIQDSQDNSDSDCSYNQF